MSDSKAIYLILKSIDEAFEKIFMGAIYSTLKRLVFLNVVYVSFLKAYMTTDI